jgi:hypothetical protein
MNESLTEDVRLSALPIVELPEPTLRLGTPCVATFRLRETVREMSDEKIPPPILSNILFAACGVNRAHGPFGGPGFTDASASNSHEIDVYVLLEEGVFRFEPRRHALLPVTTEDVRFLAFGPRQPSVSRNAPLQLVFVVDLDKLEHTSGFDEPGLHDSEVQKAYYFVDTGIIAGNVYLFAAAQGLACWFHNCDKTNLAKSLRLGPKQRVLFAQTVGFPAHPRP